MSGMIINCSAVKTKNSFDSQKAEIAEKSNPGFLLTNRLKEIQAIQCLKCMSGFSGFTVNLGKMENVNFASAFLIYSHFAWDCRDSFKSSYGSQHILHDADAVLYSLLAVFWFSTSSSIASLRFSGGGGALAFVILNSSLSIIFHCRCSGPSIVIGAAASRSTLMHLGCSFTANYQPGKPSR